MTVEADPNGGNLFASAARGDHRACDSLLQRELPALRAFIRLRAGAAIRAKESSADLVQSVCREVLQDLDRFEYRDEAAFRHWLYETALRKILDRGRYYHAQRRDADREASIDIDAELEIAPLQEHYRRITTPSGAAIAREEIARIEAAFDELPEDYRRVITLARIVGLSHAEIARALGRTEDAVRNLLGRALARLGGVLARSGG